jgi:hypothetical protein
MATRVPEDARPSCLVLDVGGQHTLEDQRNLNGPRGIEPATR